MDLRFSKVTINNCWIFSNQITSPYKA